MTILNFKLSLPSNIELIVFDFDGVFTNNKVFVFEDGTEAVMCDRSDSLGISELKKSKIPMMILSTETNSVVEKRAQKLDLPVEFGCKNKGGFLRKYLTEKKIDANKTIFVGNDLNDLEAMNLIGIPVAPADAHPHIKKIAKLVLSKKGGDGAIRELSEIIICHS